MASFLARTLRYLSGGYLITGSQVTTDQIDLGSVQIVQDVSSVLAAGRGPGRAGWYDLIIRQNIAESLTNDITFSFLDPFSPADAGSGGQQIEVSDEFDLWLYDVWGVTYNSGGTITVHSCVPSVEFPVGMIQGSNIAFSNNTVARRVLARWATSPLMENSTPAQRALLPLSTLPPFFKSPIFIPHPLGTETARLRVLSDVSTAAGVTGNLNVGFRLRAVPRGFPPGP